MTLSMKRSGPLAVVLMCASLANTANGQFGGGPNPKPPTFLEPIDQRVYQRDAIGNADVPIVLSDNDKDVKILSVRFQTAMNRPLRDGKIIGVPPGGPYRAMITYERDGKQGQVETGPFFVGDLWVLAGQSNMEGVGDLADVTPPHGQVKMMGMDGKWASAEEPLHWLVDSPDPVHSGDPATREARAIDQHKNRTKGAGLGLPFGVVMADNTGVPVGLVICAHGGTSMDGWDPAKKDQGSNSLYGSMIRQVQLAGGKVKGVLWYQGESDANPAAVAVFEKKFTDLIAAVRTDFGQPNLPFYYVQIGRFAKSGDPSAWNQVQDIQRKVVESIPNTAVVTGLDLELDDGIHVGTQGLKRLGIRLARIALREHFGQEGGTTPTIERVTKGLGNRLIVKFRDVNIVANPSPKPSSAVDQPRLINSYRLLKVKPIGPVGRTASGLTPRRHIAGFSLRKADGTGYPLIYEAMVGPANDTVILKLDRPLPQDEKLSLWYGWGYDPYCNLVDAADMAVPMFGPISLEDVK